LECDLTVLKPGRFAVQIHLYVDDAGLRESVLVIEGQGIERGEKPDQTAAP
jgi:tRNA U34 5-carboxymethylaminomethyl modifying GTPase MnmE/TrmE